MLVNSFSSDSALYDSIDLSQRVSVVCTVIRVNAIYKE